MVKINYAFKTQAVFRIHGDRAHELTGAVAVMRLREQNTLVTATPGYEPNANGGVERGIGLIKMKQTP